MALTTTGFHDRKPHSWKKACLGEKTDFFFFDFYKILGQDILVGPRYDI